jgi:hypothetical protein
VDGYLELAVGAGGGVPKAIIAPHAGYVYSGAIAGSAYASLTAERGVIRRIILLGPSHHAAFRGLATSSARAFASPLGDVPLDRGAVDRAEALPGVGVDDAAHEPEHCLEVQLPFLQRALNAFELVPLLVGDATPQQVGEVLAALWDGPETRLVVSSDLSHYHAYAAARSLDAAAARAIETLRWEDLDEDQACGCRPIRGLLHQARARGLRGRTLDLRNSGDTAGPRDRVVGYGAFAFYTPEPAA